MKILLSIAISTAIFATIYARFSYEKGYCEPSISNVIQEMFSIELTALINPSVRFSRNKGIRYDLYTSRNPYERQVLSTGDRDALHESNFSSKWPVRFLIHGWAGKSTTCSNAAIKDAYLANDGNFNIIIVDWSDYSLDIRYSRISKQLPSIAASLVKFVRFLQRETDISYESIYLIGHSAGSHISGLAGKMLKPNKLGTIYALDPAGLTQLNLGERYRLSPNDANYVESIHSDITLLGNPNYKLSHAAFFPNWGHGQPQCPNTTAAELDFTCDHFSAIYYFSESIRNAELFGAIQCADPQNIKQFKCVCPNGHEECESQAFMGGEPAVTKRGVFYFSTSAKTPFGYGRMVRMKPPIYSRTTAVRKTNYMIRGFLSRW